MDAQLVERLCTASVSKTFSPEKDVPWGIPFDSTEPQALPDPLLSLFGTPVFERMTAEQRRTLARHEVASFFSTFIRFEGVLNQNLARHVRAGDPTDPILPYMLHVIEEEARHSRMFARLVADTGVGSYPYHGLFGAIERTVSGWLRFSRPIFLVAMLGVEEITDRIFALMLECDLHPTVREVCRIHRIEESRHMQFARGLLRDDYERASTPHRLLIRFGTPLILALIFDWLVPPHVYERSGLASGRREAWSLYRVAHRGPTRRQLRHDSVSRIARYLGDVGILDQSSRRIWAAVDLVV